ncbi:MAG TPA: DUF2993 domain-containing protein [Micromonosporaceae bacterium]
MGRGRKIGVSLAVLVVVLVGLLVAVDRVAAYAAERTVARQAKQELAARQITTPNEPDVTVAGFPFLTQVARDRYDKITIKLRDVTADQVTVPRLDVVATGVHANARDLIANHGGQVTADHVTGNAVLDWQSVKQLIKLSGLNASRMDVTADKDGQVTLKAPVTLAGFDTTLVATGRLQASAGTVQVKISDVSTEGGNLPSLARTFLNNYKQALSVKVPLPRLPYQLKVQQATATPDGLVITAAADHVPISNG